MSVKIEELEELQQTLSALLPGPVVIAGGAVRDTLLQRPVKDIDVMVQIPAGTNQQAKGEVELVLDTMLRAGLLTTTAGGNVTLRGTLTPDYEDERTTFEGSFIPPGLQFKGYPINIIFVNDVEEHIRTFPDSISMVYVGDQGLVKTPEFASSAATLIIWVYASPGNRAARLHEKYGDHSYGHPFQFHVGVR